MTVEEKLTILTDAAKYDVACTSSGGDRPGGGLGQTPPPGRCRPRPVAWRPRFKTPPPASPFPPRGEAFPRFCPPLCH